MGRGSRVNKSLPIILVLLFIMPSISSITAAASPQAKESSHESSFSDSSIFYELDKHPLGYQDVSDPSHGWPNPSNIGEAYLFYRTAHYIPIMDWTKVTDERIIDGWHVLAHDYPVPSNWKNDLMDIGVDCFSYVPPQGFHCYVPEIAPNILADFGVIGTFRFDNTDKIAPDIIPILNGANYGNIQDGDKYVINLLLSGDDQIGNLISNEITISATNWRFAEVFVTEDEITWLLDQPFVEWLEPQYPSAVYDDEAANIINSDLVWDSSYMGSGNELSGDGVIIAIADTGLDNANACTSLSTCTSLNPTINLDFAGRIVSIIASDVCTGGGDGNPDDGGSHNGVGHGTHVAGSALGDGSNSAGQFKGMAFNSELWFYAAQQTSGCSGGPGLWTPGPSSIDSELFQPAYDAGARIHSNSWGTNPSVSSPNYYTTFSQSLDLAAYNYDDMVILFALGNEGKDSNQDGEVDTSWIQSAAVSKNGFSIGASENYRPSLAGTCAFADDRFPVDPIKSDYLSNNIEGLACFSNRGPSEDGRIKPDLVAPGTQIVSVYSSLDTNPGNSPLATHPTYIYKSGTSMATPITAGATALLLEYLSDNGISNPSSALIKAIWSATSIDMQGQYDTPSNNGASQSIPNNHEGWGRIDVEKAITSSFLDRLDVATSESKSIRLNIPIGTPEFRVVLSWTDSPNATTGACAVQCLVNDLDFTLKDPSGEIMGQQNGDINNLLGLTVTSPDAGDWEIIVTGTNIPDGRQNFSIATSGNYMITDMSQPVSGSFSASGFQEGSIFTETTIAVGQDHICVILDDNSMNCWGDNSEGQLGDGTLVNRQTMTPVDFGVGRTAVSIAAGESHTCAILDDASLKCWGDNSNGQLGDGTVFDSTIPVDVNLGSDVPVTISAGSSHTCVVIATADLKCWGDNSEGQLGDGTNTDSSSPISVNLGADKVLAIASGYSHTCAILNSPTLKCWGDNSEGQLGDSTNDDRNSPTTIGLDGNPVAISTGSQHTCSILADTTLKCWGDNSEGQLGDGSNTDSNAPLSIISAATSISLGDLHTCALFSSHTIKCWGDNSYSQLGDGSNNDQLSPNDILFSAGRFPITVASGGHYTCSSMNNDLLKCWGGESLDAISIGASPSDLPIPRWSFVNSAERDFDADSTLNIFDTHVPTDGDGDGFPASSDSDDNNPAIAATCMIGQYGRYSCQQATVGFYVDVPGSLIKIPASPGNYVDINGAISQSPCSIGTFQKLSGMDKCDYANPGYYVNSGGSSAQIACSGGTYNPDTGSITPADCIGADPGFNVPVMVDIIAGNTHSCAILDDGSVRCWGANNYGQLGDGTRIDRATPTVANIPLGRSAVSISTGAGHTCVIFDDSSLRCWGDNAYGQLGDGTKIERTLPTTVNLGNGKMALSVSLGQTHTCAILDDYSVKCWGGNSNGQLGDGTSSDRTNPVLISLGDERSAVSISSGSYHTCAILDNESISCWGDNWHGQIGDGSNARSLSPQEISMDSPYSTRLLDSGPFHTCAIMINNSLYCWGFNSGGQLGNGDFSSSNTPLLVPISPTQVPSVMGSGFHHTCLLLDDGEIVCWGDNARGQLGDGTSTSSVVPISVDLPNGRSALSLSVGQRHSCAILDDATLYCWGINSDGQLGDGGFSDILTPVNIDLNHGSGFQTACAPGTYQPSSGATSCILASKGFSSPNSSSLDQTGCLKGYYTNIRGVSDCISASRGFYVNTVESTDQIQCPPFKSTLTIASNQLSDCIIDTDGDSLPDHIDDDDDNDGVPDSYDFRPLDANVSADSDGDQIPDNLDPDDDNDGVNDTIMLPTLDSLGNIVFIEHPLDLFPLNPYESFDTDSDGIGDNTDDDDDNDGHSDNFDTFSQNRFEWADYDGDELGDNFDADDDNDGVCDTPTGTSFNGFNSINYGQNHDFGQIIISNIFGNTVSITHPSVLAYLPSTYPLLYPSDLVNLSSNHPSYDIELITCNNIGDDFPLDPSEYLDTDGDTLGNNLDNDDDNDGYNDSIDAFQLDNTEWNDTDGDNQGDNFDIFDNDPLEWADTDGDSVGDNSDECIFEPGLNSSSENFAHLIAIGNLLGCIADPNLGAQEEPEPELPLFSITDFLDFDGDGVINLLDIDDDNDSVLDVDDKFPLDPTRPFGQEVYVVVSLIVIFLSAMSFRLVNWQKTKIAKFRSKRVRVE